MKTQITNLLQNGLNKYLALDPQSQQRLETLENKVVTIELLSLDLTFQWIFSDKQLQIQFDNLTTPDAIIKGTPLRLLHMTIMRENRKEFFADDVSVQGDLELAQKVIDLFDNMEIDWEEHASKWIGDVSAYHLGRISKKLFNWTEETTNTLVQDINEYVHEEINLAPTREALQDFYADVDELRMQVDRLEVRCQQILLNKRGEA